MADTLDALAGVADDVREAGPDDAVDGVAASFVATPTAVEELAALLRVAGERDLAVGVRGGASKLGWGAPPERLDLLVDTARLDRVLDHAAGDLVVQAQAGVRLTDLQRRLAEADQQLALDPPETGATVGGVVATAASGPRRLHYGAPRDLLIGVTVVLADGTVAKSGGRVVKNVAGYDLGKLLTGSFGTLGVIAECVFRLHPRPPAVRVVTAPAHEPDTAGRAVQRLLHASVVPTAAELRDGELTVLFETLEPAAEAQAETLATLLDDATVGDTVPEGLGHRPWGSGDLGLRISHEVAALPQVLRALAAVAPAARVCGHAATGVTYAAWTAEPVEAAAALAELRRAVSAYDGTVVALHAPAAVKAQIDVWGPVPALHVMQRVKERFDPGHRLNPGRFVGGI